MTQKIAIGSTGIEVIKVKLTGNDIEKALDSTIQEVKGDIQLKGFRRGKAPVAHIKRIMWRELLAPAINDYVAKLLKQWEEETGRKVYAFNINLSNELLRKYNRGEELELEVEINALPDKDTLDLKDVKISPQLFEVSDSELENYINQLRERYGTLVPVEDRDTPKVGDVVVADVSVAYADSPDNKEESKDLEIEVGNLEHAQSKLGAPEVMSVFTEAKRGEELEKTVETAGGEKLLVKVLVKEIKEKKPAELNEEFFANFGDDIKTEEVFREKIRKDLEAQKIARERGGILFMVGNALYQNTEGERQKAPYAYITKIVDQIWHNEYPHLHQLWENRKELTTQENNLLFKLYFEEIFERASFRALVDIAFDFLKLKFGEEITDEEIEEFVSLLSQIYNMPPAKVRAQFQNESILRNEALFYKFAKLVKENATIAEQETSEPKSEENADKQE